MRFFAIASVLFSAAVGVFATVRPTPGYFEGQVPNSVVVILTDLSNTVAPLANQLLYATPQNATQEALTPIISNICTAVNSAISDLNLLVGQPLSVILASVDGTSILGAPEIADLLATIVNFIFKAAGGVLSVVGSATTSLIHNLLAELGRVSLATAVRTTLTTLQSVRKVGLTALNELLGDLL